jgi:hypothetical protein
MCGIYATLPHTIAWSCFSGHGSVCALEEFAVEAIKSGRSDAGARLARARVSTLLAVPGEKQGSPLQDDRL